MTYTWADYAQKKCARCELLFKVSSYEPQTKYCGPICRIEARREQQKADSQKHGAKRSMKSRTPRRIRELQKKLETL